MRVQSMGLLSELPACLRLYLRTKTKTDAAGGKARTPPPPGGLKRDPRRRGRDTGRECLQGGQKSERAGPTVSNVWSTHD